MGWYRVVMLGLAFALAANFARAGEPNLRPQMPDVPGNTFIQLGAEHTESEAAASWVRAVHQTDGILDGLTPSITPVRVPHKGRLYRLRAGPLEAANATSICTALKAHQIDCIVVR
jgi:hypothetical protein